jgi:hypothetical protein
MLALLAAGLSPGIASASVPQDHEVEVIAYLDAEEVKLGGTYEFVVAVSFPDGSDASKAGSPAPFLQLDVPKGIELTGPRLTTFKELSANEFLQKPYEQLLEDGEVSIPFKYASALGPGASIGINVVAYVAGKEKGSGSFFRQRLELPVFAGAEALIGNWRKSNWGTNKELLQIGSKAAAFLLPNAKGEMVSSESYLGKHNLIVTTYRAHW